MKYSIFISLVLLILLVGCTPVVCNEPYINYGDSCCLDENNNSICDDDETSDEDEIVEESNTRDETTSDVEEESDTATLGELNALIKAESYLSIMAFSREGLIDQLEFEGFTNEESVYGVDNTNADWYEQAALKAKSYLDINGFSREGLIDQLEFEGFTSEEAEYGVQAVGY